MGTLNVVSSAMRFAGTAPRAVESSSARLWLREKIGYFWDVESCPVPLSMDAYEVVCKIRALASGRNAKEAVFACCADATKLSDEVAERCFDAAVDVIHVSSPSAEGAGFAVLKGLDLLSYRIDVSGTLVLVTGSFEALLQKIDALKRENGHKVVLLHNGQASERLAQAVDEYHEWTAFLAEPRLSAA